MASGDYGLVYRVLRMVDPSKQVRGMFSWVVGLSGRNHLMAWLLKVNILCLCLFDYDMCHFFSHFRTCESKINFNKKVKDEFSFDNN